MRAQLAEMKNIILGMNNKKTAYPRRKTHRRTKESEAASSSSNDEKMATAAGASPLEYELTWDSMCDSEADRNIWPPPAMVTLSTLEDLDLNGLTQGHESWWDYGWGSSDPRPHSSDAGHLVSCPEPPLPPSAQRATLITLLHHNQP
jgi:hypothetical protein